MNNLESSQTFKITCERTEIQDVNVFNSMYGHCYMLGFQQESEIKKKIYLTKFLSVKSILTDNNARIISKCEFSIKYQLINS